MAIGNFKDTNESKEFDEARESIDNIGKSRNQILETSESYEDAFDKRIEDYECKEEKTNEVCKQGYESDEGKISLYDKMRNLFSKKESREETDTTAGDESNDGFDNKRKSFQDNLRKDAPTMAEQAEGAKELPDRDEYLEAREKSEQAKRDYPDLKDWELSPEQLAEVYQKQDDLAGRMNIGDSDITKGVKDGGRTLGDDAWQRRFKYVEGDE